MLIASSLSLSAPVLAAPAPDAGMMEGDGGGFVGLAGPSLISLLLALTSLTLSIVAVVDSSKSP